MITPKEKAIDIVDKIQLDSRYEMIPTYIAKIIGLKIVDEIIEAWPHAYDLEKEYLTGGAAVSVIKNIRSNIPYWEAVKQEIELL